MLPSLWNKEHYKHTRWLHVNSHCAGAPKITGQRENGRLAKGKRAWSWVDDMSTCVNNNTETHRPQGWVSSAGKVQRRPTEEYFHFCITRDVNSLKWYYLQKQLKMGDA